MRLWLISMTLTPGFEDLSGDGRERARLIVRGNVQARDPALPDQVADQHVGEQMHVDIAAAQNRRDLLAGKAVAVGEHRRDARGARTFDDGLFDPDEHRDGALEIALVDEHDFIGEVGQDARGQLARLLDRDALGERVAAERHVAALDRALHRRIELRLDPDQLDVGLHRARGDRDSRHQPAAADRNHDRVEIGRILEHLQPEACPLRQ